MEYGYCIKLIQNAWVVRYLKNDVEMDSCNYIFEDADSRERAYEQAMLSGHMYVTQNVFLIPFAKVGDPLLDAAYAQLDIGS